MQVIDNLRKRITHRRRNPVTLFGTEVKSGLTKLRADLLSVGRDAQIDPLSALVVFFRIVSPWHDRGLKDVITAFEAANYGGRYEAIIANLRELQRHFVNAGRGGESGWNRTSKGETVTPSKVFLGNIYGLWTYPVPHWLPLKDEQKGGWLDPAMDNMNAYDVVSRQAYDFMLGHTRSMDRLITDILSEVLAATR